MLDLEDEGTVLYLQSRDDADRSHKIRRFTLISMVLCVPLLAVGGLLGGFSGRRRRGHQRAGPDPLLVGGGVYIAGVLGLSRVLMGMYPPRQRVPPGGF